MLHYRILYYFLSFAQLHFAFDDRLTLQDVYRPQPYALATNTIFEAIGLLMASEQQCLFVVDPEIGEVLAAVAFVDIMEYILNSDEIHHKMKTG